MKDSTNIEVMKVILRSGICLSGKIATQCLVKVWKLLHNENKRNTCATYQEVEAVFDFNLQGIFVMSPAILSLKLTHNLMVSISICFCNQTRLEPLPCQRWSSLQQ